MKAKIFVTLLIVGQMAFAQDNSIIGIENFLGASIPLQPALSSGSIIAGQRPSIMFMPEDPCREIDGQTNFAGLWVAPGTEIIGGTVGMGGTVCKTPVRLEHFHFA